ncbi:MAG TPA: hypothetical protein VHR41_19550 [Gemmatimonadales bacterium]|nr:hypothetical protein [Gemmatimonadales bacterium]
MLRGLRVFVPALLLTASACAHSRGGDIRPTGPPVAVEVTSQYALPIEVYAIGWGITHRLGTVNPGMAGHFVVPQNLIGHGSIQFEARTNGAEQPFRSEELLVAPGSVFDFEVTPQLSNSTVTTRQ